MSILNTHLNKAVSQNNLIYHQKVPNECPLLKSDVNFGLVKLNLFTLPKPSVVIV